MKKKLLNQIKNQRLLQLKWRVVRDLLEFAIPFEALVSLGLSYSLVAFKLGPPRFKITCLKPEILEPEMENIIFVTFFQHD